MKFKDAFFSIVLICLFLSCQTTKINTKSFEQALLQQENAALKTTADIATILSSTTPDSITHYNFEKSSVLFLIFKNNNLVFWSDNWLAVKHIQFDSYNKWFYQQFDNAHCVCRWTAAGSFSILCAIPIKYCYPIENEQLKNVFLPPFKLNNQVEITLEQNKNYHIPIYSSENNYLFSLCSCHATQPHHSTTTRLAESFSYSKLLTTGGNENDIRSRYTSQTQIRVYFLLCILIIAICLIISIYSIIKHKGFRNLKFSFKFQIVFIALLLISFISVFFISISFVRQRYENRQQKDLQKKTMYIQKALQEMYFWNLSLNPANTSSLNVDLRDLSFTYETDIHVYDIHGNLVGSSLPIIFEKGLLGHKISPQPYFAQNPTMIQYEFIGDMKYLAAYTDFYNGDYMQIGYISVPLFISTDEINAEIGALLSKLFPTYLVVILLAILLSIIIGKQLTAPINMIGEKMNRLKIGQRNAIIDYSQNDEIGKLVAQYNRMVEELDKSAQLLAKSERESAWKTMARQIAHEINNPLTPMKLTIQQLQRTKSIGNEEFNKYFDKSTSLLIEQIDNLSRIAESFSHFAKMPELCLTDVDVAQKLCAVIALFRNNNEQTPIRYIGEQKDIFARTDDKQITQVFNNLFKNALQAVAGNVNGKIVVQLQKTNEWIEITFTDNGCGIPDSIRERIFMPNFTTKNTGMGLGLAICKNIIENSDGQIGFESGKQGTQFWVKLKSI